MKSRLIVSEGSSRLLLIFAGWGMDAGVFENIRRPGYDVMVVWDYRSLSIDWSIADGYEEICLFAWSMGVAAAASTISPIAGRITLKIAVNGTLTPIDDSHGIPEAIFYGTLQNLSKENLEKFFRRMCATRADRELFEKRRPSRPVEELAEELRTIGLRHGADKEPAKTEIQWDVAVIGSSDKIFPPENQRRAWEGNARRIPEVDKGHFFDFSSLIESFLIDKEEAQIRFSSARTEYAGNATVQKEVVERLVEMITASGIDAELLTCRGRVLEVGSGSGFLSEKIGMLAPEAEILLWDFAASIPAELPQGPAYIHEKRDAETGITSLPDCSISHIFSASTLQWFNSPERFLGNCARVLGKGGYAFITTFTTGNMQEIAEISGATLPLMTEEELLETVSRHFDVVAREFERKTLLFDSPLEVLRHLRLTGVNSLGRRNEETLSPFELVRRYPVMPDGKYRLTYTPALLILRKRH